MQRLIRHLPGAAFAAFALAGLPAPTAAADAVAPVIPMPATPFDLADVRLLDGPFKHAMERNAAYLLALEPDRLLHNFRAFAGLTPKGAAYGGWEADTIAGHTLGHYLSALAFQFASTGDVRCKERADYIVAELRTCQEAIGTGLVFGFPRGREIFEEIRRGDIRTRPFDLNGCWVPLYNLHKTFAGLEDVHRHCGNAQALRVATALADFLIGVLADLDDGRMQALLDCEHGGLNESFAELFALTGETRYRAAAERIYHRRVLDPLAAREDRLEGLHGNTQIPKVIGLARLYELTGNERYGAAARFFWETVVAHHTYANGGHGDNEYFGRPDRLSGRLGSTTETCNTYNMLKLTRHLFQWDPQCRYFDYYERALYNHILAHQNPETGMLVYKGFLGMPARKEFSTPFDSFWCCVGTGMENHAKYGESIYFRDAASLYVMLYVPSTVAWSEKGVTLTQTTRFPFDDTTTLTFACAQPATFALTLRCPAWAAGPVTAAVNDEDAPVRGAPGTYIALTRTWKQGDVVRVRLPMRLRHEPMPDLPSRVAFFYGPALLCTELDDKEAVPMLLADVSAVDARIAPVAGRALEFATDCIGKPRDVTLRPHFAVYAHRYSVYLDVLNEAQWARKQADNAREAARRAALDRRTVDSIRTGDPEDERAHDLKSAEKSYTDVYLDRTCRDVRNGGWFSFDLKADPARPIELLCEYWGGERNRVFDILVDDTVIATQRLDGARDGAFIEEVYPVPPALTAGKNKVRVMFKGHPEKTAGSLFGCRTLRREEPPAGESR